MAKLSKAILSCGEHHSPDGVLRVTPERLRHWESTFQEMQRASIQIPVGANHSDKLEENIPLYKKQGGGDATEAVGKLIGFENNGDHAIITLDVGQNSLKNMKNPRLAEAMAGKALDNVVEVSPVIFGQWTDGAGKTWKDCITHVDLVVHPVDHKQGPFIACGLKYGMKQCSLRTVSPTGASKIYRMSEGGSAFKSHGASKLAHMASEDAAEATKNVARHEGANESVLEHMGKRFVTAPPKDGDQKALAKYHRIQHDFHTKMAAHHRKHSNFDHHTTAQESHEDAAELHKKALEHVEKHKMSRVRLSREDSDFTTPHERSLNALSATREAVGNDFIGDDEYYAHNHALLARNHSRSNRSDLAAKQHELAAKYHDTMIHPDHPAHEKAAKMHREAAESHRNAINRSSDRLSLIPLAPLSYNDEKMTRMRLSDRMQDLFLHTLSKTREAIKQHYPKLAKFKQNYLKKGYNRETKQNDGDPSMTGSLNYHLRQAKAHAKAANDHWDLGVKATNKNEHHKMYKGWAAHREAQRAHLQAARSYLRHMQGEAKALSLETLDLRKEAFNNSLTFPTFKLHTNRITRYLKVN